MFRAPPYPLFLDLSQHPVLVVGGGGVGFRKARSLADCGAQVTVVSPAFAKDFAALPEIERVTAPYARAHMARRNWRLVIAATGAPRVNDQVRRHAQAAGILCCQADAPDQGDFSSGASVRIGAMPKVAGRGAAARRDGGEIVVAVSTAGASPVLAARLCRQAAAGIDPLLPRLAHCLSGWRTKIKAGLPQAAARRALLQRLAGEEMEAILRRRGAPAAQRAFRQWYDEARAAAPRPAKAT